MTTSGITLGTVEGKVTRWAGVKALFSRGMTARQAVNTCLLSFKRKQPRRLVRLNSAVHTAVFAPTGVGKGVSIVLPFLLTCRDSMVVVDFKGELVKLTAAARRRMGQKVVVLDPFGAVGGADTFNTMFDIDPDSDCAPDECRDLAAAVVFRKGTETDPFWLDSAEAEIALAVGFTVCFAEPHDKNLQAVRRLLSDADRRLGMIAACCQSDVWGGILARWAHQAAQLKDKTLASVAASVHTQMRFLDTISLLETTRRSTFDPADLRGGGTTVYLVLPPEHVRTQSGLLRLWVGSLLRAVVKGGPQERRKVQFVLDEASTLGRMTELEDAVDKYRGYGVRLLFLYQSLGQLKKCWPEGGEQTLLSNVTSVFFGVNDNLTADYVSARLGEFTQVVTSGGTGTGTSRQASQGGQGGSESHSWSASDNWSQAGRKLLKPEEVMALDPRVAVTFTPGVPPVATWLVRYYDADFNTPRRGVGLVRAFIDAACLLACVGFFAVIGTAMVIDKLK